MTKKLPISAIVVGLNESHLLEQCLKGIQFCDEILYFDLGSTDTSIEIASKLNATIIEHKKVPSCEWIHAKFANKTKNDWVLITDPDEKIDSNLTNEIFKLFNLGIKDNIGSITAPWIFYFKNYQLKGTAWGGLNKRVLLVNNKRFTFSPQIHVGRNLKEGYEFYEICYRDKNIIHHYWMQGYVKLFEKHIRYLKKEGEARYVTGLRTNIWQIIKEPFKQFNYSFYIKRGFKDNFLGFFLSIFWATYQTISLIQLYKFQILMNRDDKIKFNSK